jgi:hypothetical protein
MMKNSEIENSGYYWMYQWIITDGKPEPYKPVIAYVDIRCACCDKSKVSRIGQGDCNLENFTNYGFTRIDKPDFESPQDASQDHKPYEKEKD